MTRKQKLIVISFCCSNFAIGIFYSLLGPFFPIEAADKGLSSLVIGLVVGVYELVFVIIGPIFGKFIMQIGPKFMFLTGIMSCGYCHIIFGFMGYSPPGATYTALCFTVRIFEGVGAAALMTSSCAMIAHAFPDRVATMLGSLELFSGLGMMAGPPIGGWLYQLGGFPLPFIASGMVIMLLGVVTAFVLPTTHDQEETKKSRGSYMTLLTSPLVLITMWMTMCASGCIGFIDIGLAPVLNEQLGLTPLLTGFVFLIGPGVYGFLAPFWGYIADKYPNHSIWVLISGFVVGGFSFWLLGPAPFLCLQSIQLWSVIVAQLLMGLGIGTMIVGFQLFTMAARQRGMPDTLETYGMVSGVFTSSFSFGAFLGPLAGGALLDGLGFANANVAIGGITIGSAILTLIYMVATKCCTRTQPNGTSEEGEQRLLLASQ